jgi:hypothetical protein
MDVLIFPVVKNLMAAIPGRCHYGRQQLPVLPLVTLSLNLARLALLRVETSLSTLAQLVLAAGM